MPKVKVYKFLLILQFVIPSPEKMGPPWRPRVTRESSRESLQYTEELYICRAEYRRHIAIETFRRRHEGFSPVVSTASIVARASRYTSAHPLELIGSLCSLLFFPANYICLQSQTSS